MLHYGRKHTQQMSAEMYFGNNGYKFVLEPTLGNTLIFARESFYWDYNGYSFPLGAGHAETLSSSGQHARVASYVVPSVKSWIVYHFHDTSDTAPMKQACALNDKWLAAPRWSQSCGLSLSFTWAIPGALSPYRRHCAVSGAFFADFQLRPNPRPEFNSARVERGWQRLSISRPSPLGWQPALHLPRHRPVTA